jgi:hypothetical protein
MSVCSLKLCVQYPLATSQTRTALSADPVAIKVPNSLQDGFSKKLRTSSYERSRFEAV